MDLWDLEEKYGNKLRFAGIRTPSKSEMKKKATQTAGIQESQADHTQITSGLAPSEALFVSQMSGFDSSKITFAARSADNQTQTNQTVVAEEKTGILSKMVGLDVNRTSSSRCLAPPSTVPRL